MTDWFSFHDLQLRWQNLKQRQALLFLLALSLLLTLPWIGLTPLFSKGEPREALVAQAILNTGNWILPARYGDDFATKPPLTHWLMTVASLPFGEVTEWSARFPAALAMIAAVIGTLLMISKYASIQQAFISALVLLGSFEWFRAGTSARVDMVLAVFFFLAIFGFLHWQERNFIGIPWISVLGISLGILAKGPVALLLPAGIGFFFLLSSGVVWHRTILRIVLCCLLAVPLPAIWYWLAYQQGGAEFLKIVYEENIGRFLGQMHTKSNEIPHSHSVFYLYGVFLVGLLPWVLCFPFREWRKIRQIIPLHQPLYRLSLITIACVLIFFSFPESKRSVYLLPLFPFAATLLGRIFFVVYQKQPFRRVVLTLSIFFGLLLLGQAVALPIAARAVSPLPFVAKIDPIVGAQPLIYSLLDDFFPIAFYLRKPVADWESVPTKNFPAYAVVYQGKIPEVQGILGAGYTYEVVADSGIGISKPKDTVVLLKIMP